MTVVIAHFRVNLWINFYSCSTNRSFDHVTIGLALKLRGIAVLSITDIKILFNTTFLGKFLISYTRTLTSLAIIDNCGFRILSSKLL
jgi:hypothetical protein